MPGIIDELRDEKVLKRMAELYAVGLSNYMIASIIADEFKVKKFNKSVIEHVVKNASVRFKKFLDSDENIAALYERLIILLLDEGEKNMKVITMARNILKEKLDKIKEHIPDTELMIYMKSINEAGRTLNDTYRTLDKSLDRLEAKKKEIEVNTVQIRKGSIESLQELEEMGKITINPEFRKSPVFRMVYRKKKKKKVEEEDQEEEEEEIPA